MRAILITMILFAKYLPNDCDLYFCLRETKTFREGSFWKVQFKREKYNLALLSFHGKSSAGQF